MNKWHCGVRCVAFQACLHARAQIVVVSHHNHRMPPLHSTLENAFDKTTHKDKPKGKGKKKKGKP